MRTVGDDIKVENGDRKYDVDGRYRLRVRDADFDDQGGYQCSMGAYSCPVYISISGACWRCKMINCSHFL